MFKPQISHAILKTCEILPAWIFLLYWNRWHGFWHWNIETWSCLPAHSSEQPSAAKSNDLDVAETEVKAKASLKELGRSEEQCTPWSTRKVYQCFKIQNPPILICCPASGVILLPRTHQRNKKINTPVFCRQWFCLYSSGDDILGPWLLFGLGFSTLSSLQNAVQQVMLHLAFAQLLIPDHLRTLSSLCFLFFLSEDFFNLPRSFWVFVPFSITFAVSPRLVSSVNLMPPLLSSI